MKLPIPEQAFAAHTLLLGKTRSGKSSTMRLMVEHLLSEGKPGGIIDPKGDWWGLKSSRDGKRPGLSLVIFGGDHADVPITARDGKAVAELIATGNRPYIIDLGGWMVGERTRFAIDFVSTLFKLTRGPRWLAIDEVHNFAPQGKVLDPEAGKMLHWMNRLASEGAGKGITLISASQRPQKVHKDYVTSHETLIALRVIHPLDRNAVKDWIDGCDDPEKGKEVLSTLASMERGEGWVWSPEIKFGPKRIQFPLFATYDSFAAPTGESVEKLKGWASVDLDDVRAKLAVAVQEAEANDPKKLKLRIAELEKQKVAPAGASPEELAAAEARGYERGRAEAWSDGNTTGRRDALGQAAAMIAAMTNDLPLVNGKSLDLTQVSFKQRETVAPSSRPIPAGKPVTVHASSKPRSVSVTAGDNSLVEAARRVWPAKLTWAALCATDGRKARGGHFNTQRKAAIESGAIREEGNLVVLTNPPASNGATPADLLAERLPGGSRELFIAIRRQPGKSWEHYADGLGRKTVGGHWNTSKSTLVKSNLVEETDGRLYIPSELETV